MRILAIDTSCDETSVAVTEGTKILTNIIWSQASLHTKFGGVFPTLAKREHIKRIDWVINKSLAVGRWSLAKDIGAVAVTVGPGLAVSLEVGIKKAKELAETYKLPLISINHIEGHVLSPLATSKNKDNTTTISYPALGIVASGGHTQVILIEKIGKYKILASTIDDAVGEALDKGARMLGLGYPGGALLEKLAKNGNPQNHTLPIPLVGQEKRMEFSYSGIKTALYRLITELKTSGNLTKNDTEDIAATFQEVAFTHIIRVLNWMIENDKTYEARDILAGGGVVANLHLRKLLRGLAKKHSLKIHFPYSKRLYGDNAGMIGVAAFFKAQRGEFEKDLTKIDRSPNTKIDKPFAWFPTK